ncbi:hypothetical protein MOO45_00690 [Bombilactobacillus folatiphilus]|uniref:Surface layer protein A domain-containing protein n=1 Tax=Bombilactobacillus folatiphilus TaxID=2923362 RepID=A0ABY4P9G4_9LACO|nr:hypothetical protein [Bombilactobacillus folatiphilus]UQS82244.1 hypothetical protein MOO45_00690 [Bombilactobacillus folatiphilus]
MKLNKILFSAMVSFGILCTGAQTVSAAQVISPRSKVYYSNGQTTTIYSDPNLTQTTGKTLDRNVDQWEIFGEAINDAGQRTAVNLGGNQWISTCDAPKYHDIAEGSYVFNEAFSNYRPIQLYSDPQLTQPIGKLSTQYADWRINQVDFVDQSEAIYSIDVGNNQWASVEAFDYLLPQVVCVQPGTQLCDQLGHSTGKIIQNVTNMMYSTYGVKSIDGQLYVRLGSDQQWVLAQKVSPVA